VSELNDSVELSPVAFGRSGDVVRLLVCPWRHYTPWPDRLAPLSACPSRIASTPEGWYRCGKALAATGVTYQRYDQENGSWELPPMPTRWVQHREEHRGSFVYTDPRSPEMSWVCDDNCPHPSHEEQP
jgi:hypothetical protein